MSDRLMQMTALLVLTGFVGIIFWHVPRIDLGVVILITLFAVVWDFFVTTGRRKKR